MASSWVLVLKPLSPHRPNSVSFKVSISRVSFPALQVLLLFLCTNPANASTSAVPLINADFSQGPLLNDTVPETQIKTLTGWYIHGVLQYLKPGPNITLPDRFHGRAIQLGPNASISQDFDSIAGSAYSVTFTLSGSTEDNCSTADVLTVGNGVSSASFRLDQAYSENSWETRSWSFVSASSRTSIIFRNPISVPDTNFTCGPVLDAVSLKKLDTSVSSSGNLLLNGDFEEGPAFLPNSSDGVLLEDVTDMKSSPIPGWTLSSTARYIGSSKYFVPQGFAAVELLGGHGASLSQIVRSSEGTEYLLKFAMGDSKDMCLGNMSLQVIAGDTNTNVTYNSKGSGGFGNYTVKFKAVSGTTNISFINNMLNLETDSDFCGPVIDNVTLASSSYSASSTKRGICYTFALLIVIKHIHYF